MTDRTVSGLLQRDGDAFAQIYNNIRGLTHHYSMNIDARNDPCLAGSFNA